MSGGGRGGGRAMLVEGMEKRYEADACFQTFCTHWQQALRAMSIHSEREVSQDAVLAVVSHVEQIGKLLLLEAARHSGDSPPPCYTHLLQQQLLQQLDDWSLCTGRYSSAVMCEQLRLYACVVRAQGPLALRAPPFLTPLLRLLACCARTLQPQHVQEEAVCVVGEMCVPASQDMSLLDKLFVQPGDQCVGVGVVVSALHAEGCAGVRARQALLLLLRAARRHARLARSLAPPQGTALVSLATGLSGLFSLLPRRATPGRARLLPDDVSSIPRLTLFLDSLEACDAAARAAPADLRATLLELLYHGFLVPVLGPALLQVGDEAASAVQYAELCVRCVSAPGALRTLLRFLLTHEYDGTRLLDSLLAHLPARRVTGLCVLALLDTLLELNCEDVMLQLTLGCLPPAVTVDSEEYWRAADALLTLVPRAASVVAPHTGEDSMIGDYPAYLSESWLDMSTRAAACAAWSARACESPEPGSSGHSSGYDSLPHAPDMDHAERSFWLEACPASATGGTKAPTECGGGGAGAGEPLLPVLLRAARALLGADLSHVVLLTGLLSKLAAFPVPPLARALLTTHDADTSLHHVLSELKREADSVASNSMLVERARAFLRRREADSAAALPPPHAPLPAPRRSLTATLSNMFTRRISPAPTIPQGEEVEWESEAWWCGAGARRVTLNALVLGEWCRELAARAAHHALAADARAL